MAKAKALKKFIEFAKAEKKKEKALNEFIYGKKGAREIEKGAKALGKKRKAKKSKEGLKEGAKGIGLLTAASVSAPSIRKHLQEKGHLGVEELQAGGFVQRRNQRRQG
jgi:hypothetical protein